MKFDTTALVVHEMLDLGKQLKDLRFIDSPAIPVDGSVVRAVDTLNVENAVKMGADGLANLCSPSLKICNLSSFLSSNDADSLQSDTVKREETIHMPFRYRIDGSGFSIIKPSDDFPILPVG